MRYSQREYSRAASELSKEDAANVITITFKPAKSVVEWLLENDLKFRQTIAQIISSANVPVKPIKDHIHE